MVYGLGMAKNTQHRPAIGYARVSTADQAEHGVSLADQRERIAAYAKAHGYELLRVEVDRGVSGKASDNRPALQRALSAACKARGVLIVVKLDRLARNTRDAIDLAERIDKCGADLASIGEQIDTASAAGRFVFRLMASLGELERDQIAERTRAALQHKRRRGERVSRFEPFGYRLSDNGVRLIEVESEQRAIDRMRTLRDQGRSLAAIARVLDGEMVKPKRASAWSPEAVRRILSREPIGAI